MSGMIENVYGLSQIMELDTFSIHPRIEEEMYRLFSFLGAEIFERRYIINSDARMFGTIETIVFWRSFSENKRSLAGSFSHKLILRVTIYTD